MPAAGRIAATLAFVLACTRGVGGAQRVRKNFPAVRLCMVVLYEYEKSTIFHHLAYHQLAGVESVWVYVDDRTRDSPLRHEWLHALHAMRPYVRVLLWSTVGVPDQEGVRRHCLRETEEARDVTWVGFWDADEYLHLGAPLVAKPEQSGSADGWNAWDIRAELRGVPSAVLGLILPRLPITDMSGDGPGERGAAAPMRPQPPTAELGKFFFEPRAYTATRRDAEGRARAMCNGKPLLRVGRGLHAFTHNVLTDVPARHVGPRAPPFEPYPAPLTSLQGDSSCAGWRRRPPTLVWPAELPDAPADALVNYSAVHLYHYATRSQAECTAKAYNQGHGRGATIPLGGHSLHRVNRPINCTLGRHEAINVYGVAAAAEAADRRVREMLPLLAQRVRLDARQWSVAPLRPEEHGRRPHEPAPAPAPERGAMAGAAMGISQRAAFRRIGGADLRAGPHPPVAWRLPRAEPGASRHWSAGVRAPARPEPRA